MKKAKSVLYLIAAIFDLLLIALGVVALVYGAQGKHLFADTPLELKAISSSGLVWLSIGLILNHFLGYMTSLAARDSAERMPHWKRPHVLSIVLFPLLGLNCFSLVAAIMHLAGAKEESNEIVIDYKNPLTSLHLNKKEKFVLKFTQFFVKIPGFLKKVIFAIGRFFKKAGLGIAHFFVNIGKMFAKGTWKTKVSYLVMGFNNFAHKQILRGLLFFLFEAIFVVFMIFVGARYLSHLHNLGDVAYVEVTTIIYGEEIITREYVDNSFKILLYGVITILMIIAFIVTWYMNIKQAYNIDQLEKVQEKLKTDKDDLHALVDQDFYKTLLSLPLVGILIFTIMPIFFMVLVAFTNFDQTHQPPDKLFTWVGFNNFSQIFTWGNSGGASFSATFGQILVWTLIWAFFATFTNYFLGMMVAMLINKKGIKLKKLWRTVLVFSIAIPQFISLLYVSKLFAADGLVNQALFSAFKFRLPFWTDEVWARVSVIVINIWIGIPYLMLITTGILMNIPADLYESSKIDGASPFQQYMKITLPYMLFVTGPYLLTSFTGNMNNFNVIFLLTGGAPKTNAYYGSAGKTDLLITWLYSLTVEKTNYKLAAVIGIMIFIVVSVLSLVVYNIIPSTKNEEDFA